MSGQVLLALVLITLALIFYSIGVWSERIAGSLKRWHLVFFWGGFVLDTTVTGIMLELAGGIKFDLHGLTGLIAILLMLVHSIWATIVLLRNDERMIQNFHKFSLRVWLIWLIPYISGLLLSMGG